MTYRVRNIAVAVALALLAGMLSLFYVSNYKRHVQSNEKTVSVYVAKRGGTIVTCASTTGFMHQYDNRYLWMNLKRIVGSHFANYREAWEANRLIARGAIHPTLSKTYALEDTCQAAYEVHCNTHQGKVGVLCLAPREGLGVRDSAKRAKHIEAINMFRGK